MLWAITSYFNPAGYQTRKRNYDLFRSRLGVPLVTVELAYHQRFELGPGDADKLIQIRGEHVLWQKERLLNIALAHLPPGCTAVAWLDADVVFENPDWPAQALAALERCHFVQPFEELLELERHQTLAEYGGLQTLGRSFAAAHVRGDVPPDYLSTPGMSKPSGLTPGRAWAGRREALEQSGFYDAMIIGGGDRAMLYAMIGNAEALSGRYTLSPIHTEHYRNWARRFFQSAQPKIGCVPGRLVHLWHGDLEDRGYKPRHAILHEFGFDPERDVEHRPQQAWRWASAKPAMHRAVAEYFQNRKKMVDHSMLWAISSYFNPTGYRTKKRNYDLFRAHIRVPLITVELAYHQRFELGPGDADKLIQIRGEHVLWQKERLLNIALTHLPQECTTVAWLDADVVFENPDWPAQTQAALERHHFVQPFEEFLHLERRQTLAERNGLKAQYRSFAFAHALGCMQSDYLAHCGKSKTYGLSPGSAWAGRRAILDRCGFYDAMVAGGGDRAMLNAMFGQIEAYIDSYRLTPAHATHYRDWAQIFFGLAQAKVGHVPGRLVHLWHGDTKDRHYTSRQTILSESGFDPARDIKHQPGQGWRWSSAKPRLHASIEEYFRSRREDDALADALEADL